MVGLSTVVALLLGAFEINIDFALGFLHRDEGWEQVLVFLKLVLEDIHESPPGVA